MKIENYMSEELEASLKMEIAKEDEKEERLRKALIEVLSDYNQSKERRRVLTGVVDLLKGQQVSSDQLTLRGPKTRRVFRTIKVLRRPFTANEIAECHPDIVGIGQILDNLCEKGLVRRVGKIRTGNRGPARTVYTDN